MNAQAPCLASWPACCASSHGCVVFLERLSLQWKQTRAPVPLTTFTAVQQRPRDLCSPCRVCFPPAAAASPPRCLTGFQPCSPRLCGIRALLSCFDGGGGGRRDRWFIRPLRLADKTSRKQRAVFTRLNINPFRPPLPRRYHNTLARTLKHRVCAVAAIERALGQLAGLSSRRVRATPAAS